PHSQALWPASDRPVPPGGWRRPGGRRAGGASPALLWRAALPVRHTDDTGTVTSTTVTAAHLVAAGHEASPFRQSGGCHSPSAPWWWKLWSNLGRVEEAGHGR